MKTTEAIVGKWSSVLPMLGIGPQYLTGKHTACPICETGKDKFRFDNKEGKGTFYCNDCGAGGGWKMLELIHGWDFKTAAREVDKVIGNVSASRVIKSDDTEKRRARLNNLRSRIISYDKADAVIEYLKNRGISISTIAQITRYLGFIVDMEYWEDRKLLGTYPSMVAMVLNDGQPVTYHITYLEDGAKANLGTNRKILPPVRTITGGAVELFDHTHQLGIAEGIETALAATQLFEVPTWAALNAHNLKSFRIPEGVTELHIFGDNDKTLTGQKSAYELGWRAIREGLKVHVHIPRQIDTDWCDILKSKQ